MKKRKVAVVLTTEKEKKEEQKKKPFEDDKMGKAPFGMRRICLQTRYS